MKMPRHEIAAAIVEILSRRASGSTPDSTGDLHKFGEELAAYLLQEHRAGELDSLLRDVMQYRADEGIVEVVAVSAFPLSDSVRSDIETEVRKLYPQASEVIISHRLDDSIIGGVRLEFANQQLDLSIRNKLNQLKQLTSRTK